MKTKIKLFPRIFVLMLYLCAPISLAAQEEGSFFTVTGVVRDDQSRRTLDNVSVSIPGSRIGTVTNADGTFSLKIRHDLNTDQIEFSHVGYVRASLKVDGQDMSGITVRLTPRAVMLESVTISNPDPLYIVEQAMRRIGDNYVNKASTLTGFYRETVQKRQQYVDISEAVVEVYATPYLNNTRGEAVRIEKGRRVVSPRANDTLAVKLQGGPYAYIFSNVVKNREFLLNPETLHYYRFSMQDAVMIDDRIHDVIAFRPQVIADDQVFYEGNLFIDRENLTISRAEFNLDMSDELKVTSLILRKRPAGLRFTPDEVSYVVSYRVKDGRSYLNYVRNTLRFRCDWRRRIFRTNYTVVSEMVITDGRDEDIESIPYREAFHQSQTLSDKVADFYDEGFWESYNIIEPTESLESAVDRLRRFIE